MALPCCVSHHTDVRTIEVLHEAEVLVGAISKIILINDLAIF